MTEQPTQPVDVARKSHDVAYCQSAIHMQDRLDALIRVCGVDHGDCAVAITYDAASGWSLKITTALPTDVDDEPDRTVEQTQTITYSGTTIGEAVLAAWLWHRQPTLCTVCAGSGMVKAKSWEIEQANLIGRTLTTLVTDTESTPAVDCFKCDGVGIRWAWSK